MSQLSCDVLIVGGGTGGVAAALALAESDYTVIITEPTTWLGGQLTSQAVPPDEHPWIETCGCTATYREFRNRVRAHYRTRSLKHEAALDRRLNPGSGWVSRLCFEPKVGVEVINEMLAPFIASGRLTVLYGLEPVSAHTDGDEIRSITLRDLKTEEVIEISSHFVLDASELGDLLPLAGVEYVSGAESQSETKEPNALRGAPEPDNIQGFTWCAILGFDESNTTPIPQPREYEFWREYHPVGWPDKLLSYKMLHVQRGEVIDFPLFSEHWFNMFNYRQIVDPAIYENSSDYSAATCMNWPMNDYYVAPVIDQPAEDVAARLESARQLTLSMIYWVQTEGGHPGIVLRPDLAGTSDGFAMAPYHREARRIRAQFTVCEQHVAAYTNESLSVAPPFWDSVGVGSYRIDLHPSANGRPTIDTSTLPFTIPLGSLIPVRVTNLLPACKNLGVTHITNGCYRLHPVEWNIGEAAGHLAAWCLSHEISPQSLWRDAGRVEEFQARLDRSGIERTWPNFHAL